MSNNQDIEAIISLIISVIGGFASAYLIKKTLDTLDNNKKVDNLWQVDIIYRRQTQPRRITMLGSRSMKLVQEKNWKLRTRFAIEYIFTYSTKRL